MKILAISLKEAEAFLAVHERHYKAPVEAICAIGVGEVNETRRMLHGAAILGRRADGDGELAHIYVDGASQGYSLLYGACWRALKALGYEKTQL
jgi:GTPase